MRLLKILREQWESFLQMLPRDFNLEETLRQSGALQRRREIRDAQTLLRLALVYSLCGKSLRWTAAWAKVQGLAHLSDVALMKRRSEERRVGKECRSLQVAFHLKKNRT